MDQTTSQLDAEPSGFLGFLRRFDVIALPLLGPAAVQIEQVIDLAPIVGLSPYRSRTSTRCVSAGRPSPNGACATKTFSSPTQEPWASPTQSRHFAAPSIYL